MSGGTSAAPAVRGALARLRDAGAALRERPRGAVVAHLGALLDDLRAPGSALRARLAARLAASSAFDSRTLTAGLERGFDPWTGQALATLVERELGDPGGARVARGFPVTSIVQGGAIPMPSWLQIVAALAVQSPVLVRPGAHDTSTARVLKEALDAREPALGACVEVVAFPHTDAAALDALAEAECVVATGTDASVSAMARRVHPWQRFVGYGHRFSVAAIGRAGELRAACAALADDVSLWDQLGCLSPLALYAVGWRWEERSGLLDELANSFSQSEKRWPIGKIRPAEGVARAHEIAAAELRTAGRGELDLRLDADRRWALVAEPEPRFRGSPLFRFLRVHFVRDPEAIGTAIGSAARHLAAIGVAGFEGSEASRVAEIAVRLGASRVCPLGRMQSPPLDWSHDGQGVLRPLARLADLEIG